ncbi:HIT family protein [Kribbella sp. NPDC051137]|uniref:HIT family protein n=1 Tax=Kribbella sp. NPDC051137 TaxID=3155045 RepID=UPI002F514F08
MDACVFCGLISADSARWIAKESAAVAFLPLPGEEIAPGHTLVVPRRHTAAGVLDVQAADLAEVMDLAQRIAQKMVQRLGATGVCLLNASGPGSGRSVDHLHFHVVPRYPGDGDDSLPWPSGRSVHRLTGDVQRLLST